MNTLSLLLRKDLQKIFVPVLFTWLCLGGVILLPLIQHANEGAEFSVTAAVTQFFCLLMIPSGLMLALLRLIHLDHPGCSDGFLLTRPVPALMRWLPKFWLWAGLLLLPVILTQPFMLILNRMDVDAFDLMRLAFRALLVAVGIYGALALIMVSVTRERLVVWLCLPVMFVLLIYLLTFVSSVNDMVGDEPSWRAADLSVSRVLVAFSLIGCGGFVSAAWCMGKGRVQPLLVKLTGVALLALAALFFWPTNLVSRAKVQVNEDSAKVRELSQQTHIRFLGTLHEVRPLKSEKHRYSSDVILIEPPTNTREWPALVRQASPNPIRLADGTEITQGISLHSQLWGVQGGAANWRDATPTHPLSSLVRLLKLPEQLTTVLSTHHLGGNGWNAALTMMQSLVSDAPLPQGMSARLSGQAVCEWFSPVVLGSLPLQTGAAFAHSGVAVHIENAHMSGAILQLRLRLSSVHGWPGLPKREVDQHPDFLIVITHPERGEIALSASRSAVANATSLVMEEVSLTGDYHIVGTEDKALPPDENWLRGARLFIVGRVSLGKSVIPYQGELTIENLPSRS